MSGKLDPNYVSNFIEQTGDKLIKPYENAKTKLTILCQHCKEEYYPFWNNFGRGSRCGCQKGKKINAKRQLNTNQFVLRASVIHAKKGYDYSVTKFLSVSEPISFKCIKHGIVTITRSGNHIYPSGNSKKPQGCPNCGREKSDETLFEQWNERHFVWVVKKLHPNLIYDNIGYTGVRNDVSIICPKHGPFQQKGYHHIRRKDPRGCPQCSNSHGEEYLCKILTELCVDYVPQKILEETRLRWDFYLPDSEIYIEFQGQQHFKSVELFDGIQGFSSNVRRDLIKMKWVLDNKKILLSFVDVIDINPYKYYFICFWPKNESFLQYETKRMILIHCQKLKKYIKSLSEVPNNFPLKELDDIYNDVKYHINNYKLVDLPFNDSDSDISLEEWEELLGVEHTDITF
jgi:hypothetical protein